MNQQVSGKLGHGAMHDTYWCRVFRWSTAGALYLSNIRLVFVAEKADASGLAGFDIPLVYICKEKLNQPIFGCNNLAGKQQMIDCTIVHVLL